MQKIELGQEHKVKQYKPGQIPLFLRAAAIGDPALQSLTDTIKTEGVGLEVRDLRRVPSRFRDLNKVRLSTEHKSEVVDSALHVTARDLTEGQEEILVQVNNHPSTIARKEAIADGLIERHRETSQMEDLTKTGKATSYAVVISTGLELLGVKGLSMLAAQCFDDIMNARAIHAVSDAAKNTLAFVKRNWYLPPLLVGAGYLDNGFIPHLLESPSMPLRLAGGALFSSAAVIGSFGANSGDLVINIAKKYERKKEESRLKALRRSINEGAHAHWSDRFKNLMWKGIVTSELIGSALAMKHGILYGHFWSGPIDTGVGVVETAFPYVDQFLGNHIARGARHVQDWLKVQRHSHQILSKTK